MAAEWRPLYKPRSGSPMRIVFFVSGGGGNLRAGLGVADRYPDLVQIGLVVADRLHIPALTIAESRAIPVIAADFAARCGRFSTCRGDAAREAGYRRAAIEFHDDILRRIIDFEGHTAPLDLAVLSYRRWIHGLLLHYFEDRMINQHPGDLTVIGPDGRRRYVGLHAVAMALRAGEQRTRTTTFVVRDGEDDGEILCQGPWAIYDGDDTADESAHAHEECQKQVSDWPAMRFVLRAIALGEFGLARSAAWPDGRRHVLYRGRPLPYGGVDLRGPARMTTGAGDVVPATETGGRSW